jgi:hypothetical protein
LSRHSRSILQALFATFLWSTSWVLIKTGLQEIPALTFAGLRYFIAFLLLLPLLFKPEIRRGLRGLGRRDCSSAVSACSSWGPASSSTRPRSHRIRFSGSSSPSSASPQLPPQPFWAAQSTAGSISTRSS